MQTESLADGEEGGSIRFEPRGVGFALTRFRSAQEWRPIDLVDRVENNTLGFARGRKYVGRRRLE